jgi:hypothetical protein
MKSYEKQNRITYVWLLWCSGPEKPWVLGVYTDKVRAEADMRLLKNTDDGRGYIYWIQEKEVTL